MTEEHQLDHDRTETDHEGHTKIIAKTIDGMTKSHGLFVDVHHMHSFRSVQVLFPRICSGCHQSVPSSIFALQHNQSSAAVQCAACQVYAHRQCAFSKSLKWSKLCPINSSKLNGHHEDCCSREEHSSSSAAADKKKMTAASSNQQHTNLSDDNNNSADSDDRDENEENQEQNQILGSSNIQSIFRRPVDREKSLLDTSLGDDDKPIVDKTSSLNLYLLQPSASDDGILEGRRRQRLIATTPTNSVSSISSISLSTPSRNKNKNSRFPFFSASKLFDKGIQNETKCDDASSLIPKSLSWDVGVSSQSNVSQKNQNPLSTEALAKGDDESDISEQPATILQLDLETQTDSDFRINLLGDNNDGQNQDWFKQLSETLQENVLSTFSPIVNKLKPRNTNGVKYGSYMQVQPIATVENVLIDDDSSSASLAELVDKVNDDTNKLQHQTPKNQSETDNNHSSNNQSIDVHTMKGMVEDVEPQPESSVTRKRIGLATVAGGIAGGVAGLAMAGPVGFIVGVKCGQVSGILGLLLEGSLTVGALAGGFAFGAHTGQQLQDKLEETRILSLGVGTQRKLLLVRPNIQQPEAIWSEFYKEARQSFPGSGAGLVKRLMPSGNHAVKRERYERELDIVLATQDEIPTSDKVLLLVSRTLNNKESLPGHVYRCLVEKFRQRASHIPVSPICIKDEENTMIEEKSSNTGVGVAHWKERRKDAHAVIKYVTATLLEIRPGFATSPSITELTATAVESLVFGEVYSYIMEEIEAEYKERDNELRRKITDYERTQQSFDGIEGNVEERSQFQNIMISETAVEALCYLPEAHSAADKLRYCVLFLQRITDFFSESQTQKPMGADSLLKMVCQHIVAANLTTINAQVAFIEEFARDEQLLRGKEGYALVTLAASLHFLDSVSSIQQEVFGEENDDSSTRRDRQEGVSGFNN